MPKSDKENFYPTHCGSEECRGNTPLKEGWWYPKTEKDKLQAVTCHICGWVSWRCTKRHVLEWLLTPRWKTDIQKVIKNQPYREEAQAVKYFQMEELFDAKER